MSTGYRLPMLQVVWREFFDLTIPRPCGIAQHQHYDYEFIRVLRGDYRCTVNGSSLALGAGEGVLLKPGDLHRDIFERAPVHYQAVRFEVKARDMEKPFPVFEPAVKPGGQKLKVPQKIFSPLLDNLAREMRGSDSYGARLRNLFTEELLWFIIRRLPAGSLRRELVAEVPESEQFRINLRALFASLKHRDSVGVDEIAAGMHMSRRNLTRKCKDWVGISPAKAFLHYRMTIASEMLQQTGMTCQEIAAYLGFKDQYHFSKAFKRVSGVSPLNYRDGKTARGGTIVWLK